MDANNVVGGQCPFEIARIVGDHPVDDVDLLEGAADGFVAGVFAVDIDRPELAADATGVKAGHVGHQVIIGPRAGAAGEAGDGVVVVVGELFGDVVVAVDQGRGGEDAVDAGASGGVDPC